MPPPPPGLRVPLVSTEEAWARAATFAARPAGHDHLHDGDAQHHRRIHS
jgi:hypothetical protein